MTVKAAAAAAAVGGAWLYPFQRAVLRQARQLYDEKGKRRLLFPLATGLGKTVVFCHLPLFVPPSLLQRGTLILVHRDELVTQTVAALGRWLPHLKVGVEQAKRTARPGVDIIVASVQTLGRSETGVARLKKLGKGWGGVVIVDEAHHLKKGGTYDYVLNSLGVGSKRKEQQQMKGGEWAHCSDKLLAGFTATPYRADRRSLKPFFDHSVKELNIKWGITNGYLVDMRCYSVYTVTDVSGVKVRMSDFSPTSLESCVNNDKRNTAVAKALLDFCGPKEKVRAIVFCAGVKHAHDLAATLEQKGFPSRAIHGAMDKTDRKAALSAFNDGSVQVLTNFAVLTEGFDAPHCNTVVMGRPVLSPSLYMQMLGRGTRPVVDLSQKGLTSAQRRDLIAASPKPFVRIIDFVDVCSRHGGVVDASKALGLGLRFNPKWHWGGVGEQEGTSALEVMQLVEEALKLKAPIESMVDLSELVLWVKEYRLLAGIDPRGRGKACPASLLSPPHSKEEGEEVRGLVPCPLPPGASLRGVQVVIEDIAVSPTAALVTMVDGAGNRVQWRTAGVKDTDREELYVSGQYEIVSGSVVRQEQQQQEQQHQQQQEEEEEEGMEAEEREAHSARLTTTTAAKCRLRLL